MDCCGILPFGSSFTIATTYTITIAITISFTITITTPKSLHCSPELWQLQIPLHLRRQNLRPVHQL